MAVGCARICESVRSYSRHNMIEVSCCSDNLVCFVYGQGIIQDNNRE